MFNSWFHIRSFALYLRDHLEGTYFGQAFTYQKREIHFPINGLQEYNNLHFSLQPPLPFLIIEPSTPNPKNRVNLLGDLTGATITNVFWHQKDRQILIECNNGALYLLFQVFGINGNVYLLNEDFSLTDSFKKKENVALPARIAFTSEVKVPLNTAAFYDGLQECRDCTVYNFLTSEIFPYLSKELIGEICFRVGLSQTMLLANLTDSQVGVFARETLAIFEEMSNPTVRVYLSKPPILTLTAFRSMDRMSFQDFKTLPAADRFYTSEFLKTYTIAELKKTLVQKLNVTLFSLQKKLRNQQNDLEKLPTSEAFRRWANLLLTNLHQIKPHTNFIALTPMEEPREPLRIPLDPKLSPSANIQKYYTKSRNIVQSRKNLTDSIARISENISSVKSIIKAVQNTDSLKELRDLKKKIAKDKFSLSAVQSENERTPFYRFFIEGYEIRVGKSSRDNDELTLKFSNPNDFWFHAQGVSGSHVILCNPQRQASISRTVLEKTASVAAFYSKAKHSSMVPVIYTQKKYVWKPHGAEPGVVSVKFEKTLMVSPLNPKTE